MTPLICEKWNKAGDRVPDRRADDACQHAGAGHIPAMARWGARANRPSERMGHILGVRGLGRGRPVANTDWGLCGRDADSRHPPFK